MVTNRASDVEDCDKKAPTVIFEAEQSKKLHLTSRSDDVGAAYSHYFDGGEGFSEPESKRLRWKLDLRLVPILAFNIILGATDKSCTSTGALYGMREDTNSTGDRYPWVGSEQESLHPE